MSLESMKLHVPADLNNVGVHFRLSAKSLFRIFDCAVRHYRELLIMYNDWNC